MTFINELTKGDRFIRNDDTTVYTVVSRYYEAGSTLILYTVEGQSGEWSFTAPGLTTVTKIGN
jgi:hypothetical protein